MRRMLTGVYGYKIDGWCWLLCFERLSILGLVVDVYEKITEGYFLSVYSGSDGLYTMAGLSAMQCLEIVTAGTGGLSVRTVY